MDKNYKQCAETRRMINDAFIELYSNNDFEKITVTAIAEAAHLSRGTFYLYYEDIYSLLDAIETDLIAGINRYMNEVILHTVTHSKRESFCEVYVQMLEFIKSEQNYFRTLLFGNQYPRFVYRYGKSIENTFSISLDLDRQNPKEAIQLISAFLGGGIITMFKDWIMSDFSMPSYQLATIVYQALFHGLMNSAFDKT